jgi:RHS repeat-associated protein
MTMRFVYGTRPQVPDYMIEVGSGAVYRLLTDHLGSVRLVVRLSDGAMVQQLGYDPWGDVKIDTKPGFQPFGFAGGLYDPDTRLVRFGARDYDPAIGRWTAKDPSGFAGGTNLYAYADNDPVNLVDLTGENPVFFILAGAMRGIGEDILFQMTVGGKRWGCLDGEELAIAGIIGALTGGFGAPIAEESSIAKITISRRRYAEAAAHIEEAQAVGHPSMLTIDRAGAQARRTAAIGDYVKVPGKQLDEYPPAMFREGGSGASVRPIDPRQNMGAGACIGNACRGLPNGRQVRIFVGE